MLRSHSPREIGSVGLEDKRNKMTVVELGDRAAEASAGTKAPHGASFLIYENLGVAGEIEQCTLL
ncbi:hypothetical protein [Paraburkholderia kirstenboschensis]|uniref:hypothetical protein n=1 Tax=Paraburkholderia kirstenboschensis TaxID=1245436 RepID=UPI0013E2FB52